MSEIDKVEKIVQDVQQARQRLSALEALSYRLGDSYSRQKHRWYDGLLGLKRRHDDPPEPVITREEADLFQRWLAESEKPRLTSLLAALERQVALRTGDDEDHDGDSAFVNTPRNIV